MNTHCMYSLRAILYLGFLLNSQFILAQPNAIIDSLENVLSTVSEDTTKVNCLNALSREYGKIDDYKMSLQYAESALELAKTLRHKKGIAESYGHTVQAYRRLEKSGMKNMLQMYMEIFENVGDMGGVAACLNNLGNIKAGGGNMTEALNRYFTSLRIAEEVGDKKVIAGCYMNIGGIYFRQEDYHEALENYSAALAINLEINNKLGISSCYNDMGMNYAKMGQYAKALEYYFASLEMKKEIGFKIGMGNTYNNIGSIYKEQGNYEEALVYHFAALKVREEIGHSKGISGSYNNIGQTYQLMGNYEEARKYLNDGLALSKKLRNKSRISDSYEALSDLGIAEGNFEFALEHYKMYKLYEDSLANEERNAQVAELLVQFESQKKDREIELLNKDNKIKSLQLEQQEASLRASRLESERKQNEMEIVRLKAAEERQELECLQAEAEKENELLAKDRMLKEEQLGRQRLLRNAMIGGTVLLMLAGWLFFRSFVLHKRLEQQQAITQERRRISADLHDDVGTGLSKITLLSELLKTQAKTPENRKEAEKISETALELSSTISEIIWALNSKNDNLENTLAYIRHYASEYFENSPVKLNVITPDEMRPIPISGDHRRNLFYTVKEALHNILKHAQASEAELRFTLANNELGVIISDNGKGIPDLRTNGFGNGIKNMHARMKSIGGDCTIEGQDGTRVILKSAI